MSAASPLGSPPRSLPEAMARTLRHEVGDLLQSLYATVAILQKRLPQEWAAERRILADLRSRVETCRQLLDMVHDFACPMVLSLGAVDLTELTEGLVRAARERRSELLVEYKPGPAVACEGDHHRLRQLGNALLSNACEAAKSRVTVDLSSAPSGAEIEWTFTDDGPGIPAETQPQLFQPFFSTHHARAGLGLALAKKIAQLHGGNITFTTPAQGGAAFRVLLPFVQTFSDSYD
jgi:signal transduction histidine kinase